MRVEEAAVLAREMTRLEELDLGNSERPSLGVANTIQREGLRILLVHASKLTELGLSTASEYEDYNEGVGDEGAYLIGRYSLRLTSLCLSKALSMQTGAV